MNTYSPMLALPAERPFDDPGWVFEVKWDGIRAIAYVGETLSVRSRGDKELLGSFPELEELRQLTSDAVLDGEIIVMRDGRPDFRAAVQRNQLTSPAEIEEARSKNPATYVVFDILEKDGVSLIDRTLKTRLQALGKALRQGRYVVVSAPVEEHGVDYYEAAVRRGMEGVVAKRLSSTYQPGSRSSDWLKIKRVKSCDCVVFGYTPGEGARADTFGALLLGLYDEGRPVYVGRVGTGFTDADLKGRKGNSRQPKGRGPLVQRPRRAPRLDVGQAPACRRGGLPGGYQGPAAEGAPVHGIQGRQAPRTVQPLPDQAPPPGRVLRQEGLRGDH